MRRAEVKDIITDEIILSRRADEVDTRLQNPEIKEIIADLKATMRAKNIKALSAPAIGYNKRIFCVDAGYEIKTYINPVPYNDSKSKPTIQTAIETCTSIPNKRYIRFRTDKISLFYQRPNGQPEHKEFSGWLAVVIQHEVEHLDGITLADFGLELDDSWEKLSKKDQAEIMREYKDSLDILAEKINDDIISDPEAKQLQDGINYMTDVATGKLEIEGIE